MKYTAFFAFFCLVFCAGCVQQEVEYTKKWGFGFKDKVNYPKLKDYDLTLELSSGTRKFKAGYPAELTFILCNRGKKALRIPECSSRISSAATQARFLSWRNSFRTWRTGRNSPPAS